MPQPPECPDDMLVYYLVYNLLPSSLNYLPSYKVMRNCWKTQPTDRPSFTKLVARLQDLKDQYKSLPHVSSSNPNPNLHIAVTLVQSSKDQLVSAIKTAAGHY